MAAKQKVSVGVDIGGTNTVVGVVSADGVCLSKASFPSTEAPTIDVYIDRLADTIKQLLAGLSDIALLGIGIAAPNANYHSKCIEDAPNMKYRGIIPIGQMIADRIPGVKVEVTNDANAATIGEMQYGGAKGMKDFLMITLGTGVGSGIVSNGKLIYGFDGMAGELGHTIVIPNGRQCSCGRKGCLETYASARGIKQTAIELLEKPHDAVWDSIAREEITPAFVSQLAEKGDPTAKEVYEKTGWVLGLALANAVAYTSPQAIFLSGGIARAEELLFAPTRRSFNENLLFVYKTHEIPMLHSTLNAGDVAVLGAAALVL